MVDYKLELTDAQGQTLKIDITGTDVQMKGNNFDMCVSSDGLKNLTESVLSFQKLMTDFKLKEVKLEKITE